MTRQTSGMRFTAIFFLFLSLFLAACGGEVLEPTPILPPPNVNDSEIEASNGGSDTAVDPTLETGQIETSTAVAASESEPTPTLEPTATLTATATPAAIPALNPPLQAITGGQMPPSSRDLLFLADGAFKRWNQAGGRIETLLSGPVPGARVPDEDYPFPDYVGDITHFSVSEDGKRAVAVRLTASEIVSHTVPQKEEPIDVLEQAHELWFLDLVSGESWLILPNVDNLRSFDLSPDAAHVAFIGSSLDGNNNLNEEGGFASHVYVLPTGGGNPGSVVNVADCAGFCGNLAWHPDNNLFTWNDQNAVWLRNLSGSEPEVLLENLTFNVHVQDIGKVVEYAPLAWANNGRYLLLSKRFWEGSSQAVFDVPTRVVVELPNTYNYVRPFAAEVSWMPDDRLYLLRSLSDTGRYQPQIELWRFHPEQNSIDLEESALLSTGNLGAAGQQYLDDGRFAYMLFGDESNLNEAGMYHLTSLSEAPLRVNAAPPVQISPGSGQAIWSSDGAGALIVPAPGAAPGIYYGPAGADFLYDISAMLGADAHAFRWQPEIIIP